MTSKSEQALAYLIAGPVTLMSVHRRMSRTRSLILIALALLASPSFAADNSLPIGGASADETNADVAKKLQNPVASLISVPIENNFDFGGGTNGDAFQYKVNIQPVIPMSISRDWNLITRAILPIIHQENVIGRTSQSGLGDTVLSLFLSPKAPTSGGWIWGAGPVLLLRTATNDVLGAEKWGAGPTAVILRQQSGWTYGALVNHIWSFDGNDARANVSATFMEPFVTYTTKNFTTFGINTESTYDWHNSQWTVPINISVSQLLKLGGRPISFKLGTRYYADKPDGGPKWGLRFDVTLLFPK